MHRKGIIRAAACAALVCGGLNTWAKADRQPARALPTDLSLAPKYLDDAPAAPTARTPLMELMDRVGAGKALDDAGISIGGYAEGSYTFSTRHPPAGSSPAASSTSRTRT